MDISPIQKQKEFTRGVWQLQSHVSYCLYGSKKHMMEQIYVQQLVEMNDPILALWQMRRVWKE